MAHSDDRSPSDKTVSEQTLSEETLSEETLSGETAPEKDSSGDALSEDTSGDSGPAQRDLSPPDAAEPSLDSTARSGSAPAVEFLPDEQLNPQALREALSAGSEARRLELLGQIVSFAPWDEVWSYVSQEELREALPQLDVSDSLRAAWQRYLETA